MSLLGDMAAKGLSMALGTALKASPVDAGTVAAVMDMVGGALKDLAGKSIVDWSASGRERAQYFWGAVSRS